MKAAVFSYSKNGIELALKVREILTSKKDFEVEIFAPKRFLSEDGGELSTIVEDTYKKVFDGSNLLVFVSSCGVAIRCIAPYLKGKTMDPAVVCIDERAVNTVSLLSGHIGGANSYAKLIADNLGSNPVITTATDVNGRFAADSWAIDRGFAIRNVSMVKEISSRILEGEVSFSSDYEVVGKLPLGLTYEKKEAGVYVSHMKGSPYNKTLKIVPGCVVLGIGCRKNTSKDEIVSAIRTVLDNNNMEILSIGKIASIDLKKDEKGLLEAAGELDCEISFYTADELMGLEGDFSKSDFVRQITGADNVCERAAFMETGNLCIKRTVVGNVTIAAGIKEVKIDF